VFATDQKGGEFRSTESIIGPFYRFRGQGSLIFDAARARGDNGRCAFRLTIATGSRSCPKSNYYAGKRHV